MRLALALDTTPDAFLVGAVKTDEQEQWRKVAQRLRMLSPRQLNLAEELIDVAARQDID